MNKILAIRGALVTLIVVCFGFVVGSQAAAQTTPTITLLHGIPGVPVDVVVGGNVVFANFQGGETKDLSSFAGQTLTGLEVRPAGGTTAVIGPVDFKVPAAGNWTAVAHLDADGKPTLTAFENDMTPTASGKGRLVVVHTAAAPPVDLVVGTDRPITNLANGSASPLELTAGEIAGAKLAPTGQDPIIDVPTVNLVAGTDLIVYAVGSVADSTVTFYTQSITVGENTTSTTTSTSTSTTTSTSSTTTSTSTTVADSSTTSSTSSSSTSSTSTTIAPINKTLTLLHGIPGVAVDVAVDGTVVFANFQGGETQDLSALAGQTLFDLEVRLAGTTTAVIGPVDFALPTTGNWTVAAHLDADGKPILSAFENNYDPLENSDGRLTIMHTAAAPAVDLVVGETRPIVDLANGDSQSLVLKSGPISGAKLALTGKDPTIDVPEIDLKPGTNLLVFAVGSVADETLTYYTQTIEAGSVAVDTTTSTTKPKPKPVTGSGGSAWLLAILLLGSGALLTVMARRTPSHRPE